MKSLLLFLSALCAFVIPLQAQLSFGVAVQGQGDFYDDAASVTFDTQNNLYVTGYFASDSISFGNITLHSAGASDAYVVKYDPWLNPVWAVAIGGSGEEYGLGISCDSSNRVIVVGNFSSASLTLGSSTINNRGTSTPDMFVVRLDDNGNFIWARSEGTANWDNCAGVDMNTQNGDVYVSAAYYLGEMIIGNDTLPNRGGYDMVLMKFDINGNYLWSRDAGGNYNDLANAVAFDADGYVITSGGFASDTLKFPTDTLINPVMGLPETFVVKYDESGNCIWAERAGAGDNDHSVAIDVDANGIIYVGGHYHSGSFVFGNDTLVNQGQGDVYLLVYDANGNQLWGKSAGGIEQDFGYGTFVDAAGNIYLSGMFTSLNITFGPYTHSNSNINEDMFMTMYDAAGNETGSLAAGGLGMDYINSVTATPIGVYMVGSFGTPVLTIGPSTLTNTDASGNTSDMFIAASGISLNVQQAVYTHNAVFPNPGTGVFNFSSSTLISTLTIYNSIGEVIRRDENLNAKSQSVDLSGETAGIYFYNIADANGNIVSGCFVLQ